MKGLEFGKKGAEGIKGEGIDETKGWASLENEPFAGEDMVEQANRINEMLESIDLPEFESEQDNQPKTSENTQDDIQGQMDSLKAELHSIFKNSHDSTSMYAADLASRPIVPRTPPTEAVPTFNGNSFYPTNYDGRQPETIQSPQPEKSEAEKDQIRKELSEAKAQLAETLEWAKQQPNEPKFWRNESSESQEAPSRIDEIERIQQSMNPDILGVIKEMEYRRQSDLVPDYDWEMDKKDPQYRKEWEAKRKMVEQNIDNRIIDIEGVYNLDNDYRASVVSGGGGRTMEKITKEQYDLLKKQFPEENAESVKNTENTYGDTNSQIQDQLTSTSLEQDKQEEALQEKPTEPESQIIAETDSSVETKDSLKNETINQIISKMLNVGDFRNSGLDISQKMRDIEYAKKKLQDKTLEELRSLLSTYE